jgi:hypothetical protein
VAEAFQGRVGFGLVVVYTVPRAYDLRLGLLTFTLTTDATAGVHQGAKVVFTDTALGGGHGAAARPERRRAVDDAPLHLRHRPAASACVAATGGR